VKALPEAANLLSNVYAKDIIKKLQKNIVANFMAEPLLDPNLLKAE
tara:strand:- start:198 stop:335 length:138 start_codon:yes stop_codon:yes gene_type:complete